jgi:large subunit ribosomal protein L25
MAEFGVLTATVRGTRGKGAARTLRREGKLPAVIYGRGKENLSLALDPREFGKATDPARQWNTLFQVTLKQDGKPDIVETCMVADVQMDSIRNDVKHVDFMRVDPEKEVVRMVPLRVTGKSIGITKGGKLTTFRRSLHVAAKPEQMPVEVVVDITAVDTGEAVRMGDVKLDNARLVEAPQQRLCLVEIPKKKEEEAEGGAAKPAAAGAAKPAAAKPAAGGKEPAKK